MKMKKRGEHLGQVSQEVTQTESIITLLSKVGASRSFAALGGLSLLLLVLVLVLLLLTISVLILALISISVDHGLGITLTILDHLK